MPWVANSYIKWKGEDLEPGDRIIGFEDHRNKDAMVVGGKVTASPPEGKEYAWVANRNITFRGEELSPGDPIPDFEDYMHWKDLVERDQVTAAPPENDNLDKYHEGHGWYDIPGVDKKVRKEEARELLK